MEFVIQRCKAGGEWQTYGITADLECAKRNLEVLRKNPGPWLYRGVRQKVRRCVQTPPPRPFEGFLDTMLGERRPGVPHQTQQIIVDSRRPTGLFDVMRIVLLVILSIVLLNVMICGGGCALFTATITK